MSRFITQDGEVDIIRKGKKLSQQIAQKHYAGQHSQQAHAGGGSKGGGGSTNISTMENYQQEVNPEFRRGTNSVVPQESQDALRRYKGELFEDINNVLRNPMAARENLSGIEFDSLMGYANNIDKVMNLAPGLPQELITYRGTRGAVAERFKNMSIGTIFQDDAFVSTTMRKSTAEDFANITFGPNKMVLEIINPKGQKGIMLDAFGSGGGGEYEWLLPRGLKYEVLSTAKSIVGDINEGNIMSIRVLP